MQVTKINLFSAHPIMKSTKNLIPSFGIMPRENASVDTFVRTEKPNAKKIDDNQTYDEFKRWAINSGYFTENNPTSIPALTLIDNSDKYRTYEMQGTNKWVLKKLKNAEIIPGSHTKTVIQKVKDVIPDINIGQTIARVEIPINESYSSLYFINKRLNGHPVALPNESYKRYDLCKKEDIETFKQNIELISKAPQEAYDTLLRNALILIAKNYKLDTNNPENIIYDPDKKEFHIKNVTGQNVFGENNAEEQDDNDKFIQHYSNIFTALVGGKYGIKYYRDAHNKYYNNVLKDKKLGENLNRITIKYTQAMQANGTCFLETDNLHNLLQSGVLDGIIQPKDINARFYEFKRMTTK